MERTLGSALHYSNDFSHVRAYDIASSAQLSEGNLEHEWVFHLWVYEKSFRFISMPVSSHPDPKFSIFEIGSTPTKIEQLPVIALKSLAPRFCPSTYRIFISNPDTLCILDAWNLQSLLQEGHKQPISRFSSVANLFAAPYNSGFRVCKYASGSYVLSGKYLLSHIPSFSRDKLKLEFPSNSTSILSLCKNVLQVWRLSAPSTTPRTCRQFSAISRSGRYVATAHESQTTVTIINQHLKTPLFIDAGGEIEGLAINGDVLLVAFSETVVG